MTTSRKTFLSAWIRRARADLEHAAREIADLPDDGGDPPNVSEDLHEVQSRLDALESRVTAIEGAAPA